MANRIKAESGAEVYEHEIFIALEDYAKHEGIADYREATQNEWTAALMDV